MSNFIDLSGQRFGRLTVIKKVDSRRTKGGQYKTVFLCQCDCGKMVYVDGAKLRKKHTQSCGCLHKEIFAKIGKISSTKHSLSDTRIYNIWQSMKQRCYQKNAFNYKNYGFKGITVCNEWKNDFISFYNWSIANGYDETLSIDRIDVNGNYEPSNCRWVDMKTQENNRKNNIKLTFQNVTLSVSEWAEKLNIVPSTIYTRLKRGWTTERTLTTPIKRL